MPSATIQSAMASSHVSCVTNSFLFHWECMLLGFFFFKLINFFLCVSMLVFLWQLGEKGAVAKNGGLSVNVSLSAKHTEAPHVLHSFTASSLQPGDYAHQQACTSFSVHGPVPVFHYMFLSVASLNCPRLRNAITVYSKDYSSFLKMIF